MINILRTDEGREYTSHEFANFYEKERIVHGVTSPYTPQYNSIVERKNMAIINTIRSMMKEKGLPHYLWGELVATIVYILSKCPTKRLIGKTLEEAWLGRKLRVKHLRIIGSFYFKHVPE